MSTPTRARSAWLLVVWCAASWALGCSSAPQGQAWLRVRTAHFDLRTDLRRTEALDTARALEEARASLLTLAWRGATDPPGRTEVVVFASEDRFHDYVPNEQVAGLAQSHVGFERLIVTYWDDERPSGLPARVVHEIAHDVSLWFTPLQPAWYAEGMACFLEGVQFERGAHQVILGDVPDSMVRILRRVGRKAENTERIFEARRAIHDDRQDTTQFYFTSWLLVHYLVNHHGARFDEFQRDLSELRDWREAWSRRFAGLSPRELDARLERYLEGGQFGRIGATANVPPFAPRVRKLSAAQAQGLSSWLAYRLGAHELSAQESDVALSLDPDELNALRARYHSLQGSGAGMERRAIARRLVRVHPEQGEAWLLLAHAGESDEEREGALDRAYALMPYHPGVLELRAVRALGAEEFGAALEHTQILIRRTVPSPRIALLHVRALAGAGQCDAARRFAKSSSANYGTCSIQERGRRVACATRLEKVVEEGCARSRSTSGQLEDTSAVR